MKVLVMAGGTGGHVYPALAVAHVLRAQGHEVVWMGAPESFEARVVPPQGFPMELVRVTGLRGKGAARLLYAPLTLLRALREALAALRRQRPHVVLGMGGFAAGPGGIAARLRGIPLVIHEQNAAPGMTNRLLALVATRVLEAFPRTFRNALTVGNPVRSGFDELPSPAERQRHLTPGHVLVVGGSQGAKALNELMPRALRLMPEDVRPHVRHQAGRTLEVAQHAYHEARVVACVEQFIHDMPAAYQWADLVVCRAGASTVAELASAGSAALLVPFPHAVDDHQTRNAEYLVQAGAAVLAPERDLTPEKLAALLQELLADRERLLRMAEAARRSAWTGAAERIAAECVAAGGGP